MTVNSFFDTDGPRGFNRKSVFYDDCGGPDLASFAAAHESEPFGGGRFYGDGVDGNAENRREGFPHRDNVRGQFGTLEGDGDIDIPDPEAALLNEGHDLAEEELAVDAFPLVGGVGKQMADVSEGEGPRRASQSAWMATSPSECATKPVSEGMRTPPSHIGSPCARACTSYPFPILSSMSTKVTKKMLHL